MHFPLDIDPHDLEYHEFKQRFLLGMKKKDFEYIIEQVLICEIKEKQNLVVRVSRVIRDYVIDLELYSFFRKQLLSSDVIEGVQDVVPAVLEGLSVLYLQDVALAVLFYDLLLSQLDFFLPASWTVEFLIIFAEVKAAIIQTFIEVFSSYFLASFLKLSPASGQFHQFLLQSRKDNGLSDLCLWIFHHIIHDLSRINIAQYLLYKRMGQLSSLLYDPDAGMKRGQVRIDFVLLFLVSQELLFVFILSCDHETSLGSQRNRHTDTIQGTLQLIFRPAKTPVSISVRNNYIAISNLFKRILLIYQLIEWCKNGDFPPLRFQFLSVLIQHIEERWIRKVNRLQNLLELTHSDHAASIQVNHLRDLATSFMLLQSKRKLLLGELFQLRDFWGLQDLLDYWLFDFEPVQELFEDGEGIGIFGCYFFDFVEGGGFWFWRVKVLDDAAVEVVVEIGRLQGDNVQYLLEGDDGGDGCFGGIPPGVEAGLEVLISVGVVQLREKSD